MKKRSRQHLTPTEASKALGRHDLPCVQCGCMMFDVAGSVKAITCWKCVAKMADPPDFPVKPTEKRPPGWQFRKEYISPSGQVYHRGKLVDASPVVKRSVKITSAGTS